MNKEQTKPKFTKGDIVRNKLNGRIYKIYDGSGFYLLEKDDATIKDGSVAEQHLELYIPKTGDKVYYLGGGVKNKVYTILSVKGDMVETLPCHWVNVLSLKPYTEETMEEKELNLCELLKGCEGETFYSDVFELVILTKVNLVGNFLTINWNRLELNLYSSGSKVKGNRCILWPSEELYEKYPLDPYSAWMEWKEARKPKRWRAEIGEIYWRISAKGNTSVTEEYNTETDDYCYNYGNYFRTKEEAEQAAEIIKDALHKFHEQNM